jgi:hypothetical protein
MQFMHLTCPVDRPLDVISAVVSLSNITSSSLKFPVKCNTGRKKRQAHALVDRLQHRSGGGQQKKETDEESRWP